MKETTAWALPAVADTDVGAVGVPPPRDEDVPSIGIVGLFYISIWFATNLRGELMALHNHLLLNAKVKRPPVDAQETIDWLRNLVESIGMKVIQGPFASYVEKEGNRGLTATVMIETSHIAFHVWDEESPALLQFDLYTCSTLPVPAVIKMIDEFLEFDTYRYIVYERANEFNIVEMKEL